MRGGVSAGPRWDTSNPNERLASFSRELSDPGETQRGSIPLPRTTTTINLALCSGRHSAAVQHLQVSLAPCALPVMKNKMFEELGRINERPEPFEFYTAKDLWTDEHTSAQMLSFHLNGGIDVSSRKAEFIDRSVEWIASEFNIGKDTKIADFGCGPGLYATRLAKRRAKVTGIDFSGRSIEYAKAVAARENLNISYVQQNYLDFETQDRFNLVMMIMCDFCALGPRQRKEILSRFRRI